MTIREDKFKARSVSIPSFLASIGVARDKSNRSSRWIFYKNPFRDENIASFCVNPARNRWFDFGETDKNGDIIDLVKEIKNCTFPQAINYLVNGNIDYSPPEKASAPLKEGIEIVKIKGLSDQYLVNYILSRKVNIQTARDYCHEVWIKFPNSERYPYKVHKVIGFKNRKKGWEFRNRYLKVSNSPKYHTFIKGENNRTMVFEGFFDFLSALTYFTVDKFEDNVIVLNSLSFLREIEPILRASEDNFMFFDHDDAADEVMSYLEEEEIKCEDCRFIYRGYKDFNKFLMGEKIEGYDMSQYFAWKFLQKQR